MDERTTSVRPRAGRPSAQAETGDTASTLPFAAVDNPDDMPYEGQLAELEPIEDPVEFRQVAPDDHD
jgi:hypothetical protein